MHFYSTSSNTLWYQSIVQQIHPQETGSIPEISVRVRNSKADYGGNAIINRWVFNLDLNVLSELADLTDNGREFQVFGPTTEKALLPSSVLVLDTSSKELANLVE